MITHHTQLLNALIEKYDLKSYLEIGVQTPEQNFYKINCGFKVGVDPCLPNPQERFNLIPDTSDMFFTKLNTEWIKRWPQTFDLIFIDGLHHADQVKRDFENSLRCLSDNGFILIHDVLPENEAGTMVPRVQRQWWGDVWKFAFEVYKYGYEYKTFDIDNGCMLIQKIPIQWNGDEYRNMPSIVNYDWQAFNDCKQQVLRITNEVTI